MASVLVIGGTGNISTAVTAALVARGMEVTLLNRGHQRIEGTRCVVADRNDRAGFAAAVHSLPDFDCVVDMIGYEPEDGRQLIECFGGRVGQLIFSSTVDTYAKPAPKYPVVEGMPRSQNPAFRYAHKKGILEEMLEMASQEGAFALTILRPAATYNDHGTPIGILSDGLAVMRRLRYGLPVILPGDGTSLWTSTHRDDVGLAFSNAVLNQCTYGRDYIIAGDAAISWYTYYDTVREVLGGPDMEPVYIPSDFLAKVAPEACNWCPLNFRFSNIFDCTQAARDLGFRYTVPWHEGVRRMVEYWDGLGAIDSAQDHPVYEPLLKRWATLQRDLLQHFHDR